MSSAEEDDIIRREFKRRNGRGICKLLVDIRDKLTRPNGWHPTLAVIVHIAQQLGIEVKWK